MALDIVFKSTFFQITLIVAAAFAAVALADRPVAPPPPPRRPVYREPEYKQHPQPYAYQYGVQDQYSGASFDKTEKQDENGNLQGQYRVNLPDGRVQVVTYRADHVNGYIADVKYEGTPVYPPAPKGGYGPYKPAPAPQPVRKRPQYN